MMNRMSLWLLMKAVGAIEDACPNDEKEGVV
jgi:hypothetical protein